MPVQDVEIDLVDGKDVIVGKLVRSIFGRGLRPRLRCSDRQIHILGW
jgi:hypothetical protein